jgi:hypothetical protein
MLRDGWIFIIFSYRIRRGFYVINNFFNFPRKSIFVCNLICAFFTFPARKYFDFFTCQQRNLFSSFSFFLRSYLIDTFMTPRSPAWRNGHYWMVNTQIAHDSTSCNLIYRELYSPNSTQWQMRNLWQLQCSGFYCWMSRHFIFIDY